MYYGWRKHIWFKIIALAVAGVFLLQDVSWAARNDMRYASKQYQPSQAPAAAKTGIMDFFKDISSMLIPSAHAAEEIIPTDVDKQSQRTIPASNPNTYKKPTVSAATIARAFIANEAPQAEVKAAETAQPDQAIPVADTVVPENNETNKPSINNDSQQANDITPAPVQPVAAPAVEETTPGSFQQPDQGAAGKKALELPDNNSQNPEAMLSEETDNRQSSQQGVDTVVVAVDADVDHEVEIDANVEVKLPEVQVQDTLQTAAVVVVTADKADQEDQDAGADQLQQQAAETINAADVLTIDQDKSNVSDLIVGSGALLPPLNNVYIPQSEPMAAENNTNQPSQTNQNNQNSQSAALAGNTNTISQDKSYTVVAGNDTVMNDQWKVPASCGPPRQNVASSSDTVSLTFNCATKSLSTILPNVDVNTLAKELTQYTTNGQTSLYGIQQVALSHGLDLNASKITYNDLINSNGNVLVHLDLGNDKGHYVVKVAATEDSITIIDNGQLKTLTGDELETFKQQMSGYALASEENIGFALDVNETINVEGSEWNWLDPSTWTVDNGAAAVGGMINSAAQTIDSWTGTTYASDFVNYAYDTGSYYYDTYVAPAVNYVQTYIAPAVTQIFTPSSWVPSYTMPSMSMPTLNLPGTGLNMPGCGVNSPLNLNMPSGLASFLGLNLPGMGNNTTFNPQTLGFDPNSPMGKLVASIKNDPFWGDFEDAMDAHEHGMDINKVEDSLNKDVNDLWKEFGFNPDLLDFIPQIAALKIAANAKDRGGDVDFNLEHGVVNLAVSDTGCIDVFSAEAGGNGASNDPGQLTIDPPRDIENSDWLNNLNLANPSDLGILTSHLMETNNMPSSIIYIDSLGKPTTIALSQTKPGAWAPTMPNGTSNPYVLSTLLTSMFAPSMLQKTSQTNNPEDPLNTNNRSPRSEFQLAPGDTIEVEMNDNKITVNVFSGDGVRKAAASRVKNENGEYEEHSVVFVDEKDSQGNWTKKVIYTELNLSHDAPPANAPLYQELIFNTDANGNIFAATGSGSGEDPQKAHINDVLGKIINVLDDTKTPYIVSKYADKNTFSREKYLSREYIATVFDVFPVKPDTSDIKINGTKVTGSHVLNQQREDGTWANILLNPDGTYAGIITAGPGFVSYGLPGSADPVVFTCSWTESAEEVVFNDGVMTVRGKDENGKEITQTIKYKGTEWSDVWGRISQIQAQAWDDLMNGPSWLFSLPKQTQDGKGVDIQDCILKGLSSNPISFLAFWDVKVFSYANDCVGAIWAGLFDSGKSWKIDSQTYDGKPTSHIVDKRSQNEFYTYQIPGISKGFMNAIFHPMAYGGTQVTAGRGVVVNSDGTTSNKFTQQELFTLWQGLPDGSLEKSALAWQLHESSWSAVGYGTINWGDWSTSWFSNICQMVQYGNWFVLDLFNLPAGSTLGNINAVTGQYLKDHPDHDNDPIVQQAKLAGQQASRKSFPIVYGLNILYDNAARGTAQWDHYADTVVVPELQKVAGPNSGVSVGSHKNTYTVMDLVLDIVTVVTTVLTLGSMTGEMATIGQILRQAFISSMSSAGLMRTATIALRLGVGSILDYMTPQLFLKTAFYFATQQVPKLAVQALKSIPQLVVQTLKSMPNRVISAAFGPDFTSELAHATGFWAKAKVVLGGVANLMGFGERGLNTAINRIITRAGGEEISAIATGSGARLVNVAGALTGHTINNTIVYLFYVSDTGKAWDLGEWLNFWTNNVFNSKNSNELASNLFGLYLNIAIWGSWTGNSVPNSIAELIAKDAAPCTTIVGRAREYWSNEFVAGEGVSKTTAAKNPGRANFFSNIKQRAGMVDWTNVFMPWKQHISQAGSFRHLVASNWKTAVKKAWLNVMPYNALPRTIEVVRSIAYFYAISNVLTGAVINYPLQWIFGDKGAYLLDTGFLGFQFFVPDYYDNGDDLFDVFDNMLRGNDGYKAFVLQQLAEEYGMGSQAYQQAVAAVGTKADHGFMDATIREPQLWMFSVTVGVGFAVLRPLVKNIPLLGPTVSKIADFEAFISGADLGIVGKLFSKLSLKLGLQVNNMATKIASKVFSTIAQLAGKALMKMQTFMYEENFQELLPDIFFGKLVLGFLPEDNIAKEILAELFDRTPDGLMTPSGKKGIADFLENLRNRMYPQQQEGVKYNSSQMTSVNAGSSMSYKVGENEYSDPQEAVDYAKSNNIKEIQVGRSSVEDGATSNDHISVDTDAITAVLEIINHPEYSRQNIENALENIEQGTEGIIVKSNDPLARLIAGVFESQRYLRNIGQLGLVAGAMPFSMPNYTRVINDPSVTPAQKLDALLLDMGVGPDADEGDREDTIKRLQDMGIIDDTGTVLTQKGYQFMETLQTIQMAPQNLIRLYNEVEDMLESIIKTKMEGKGFIARLIAARSIPAVQLLKVVRDSKENGMMFGYSFGMFNLAQAGWNAIFSYTMASLHLRTASESSDSKVNTMEDFEVWLEAMIRSCTFADTAERIDNSDDLKNALTVNEQDDEYTRLEEVFNAMKEFGLMDDEGRITPMGKDFLRWAFGKAGMHGINVDVMIQLIGLCAKKGAFLSLDSHGVQRWIAFSENAVEDITVAEFIDEEVNPRLPKNKNGSTMIVFVDQSLIDRSKSKDINHQRAKIVQTFHVEQENIVMVGVKGLTANLLLTRDYNWTIGLHGQFNAYKFLLESQKLIEDRTDFDQVSFVVDVPMSDYSHSNLFGLSNVDKGKTKVTIISGDELSKRNHKLNAETADHMQKVLTEDNSLLDRITVEVVHEIGHNKGLEHCNCPDCAMNANKPGEMHRVIRKAQVTEDGSLLCSDCQKKLALARAGSVVEEAADGGNSLLSEIRTRIEWTLRHISNLLLGDSNKESWIARMFGNTRMPEALARKVLPVGENNNDKENSQVVSGTFQDSMAFEDIELKVTIDYKTDGTFIDQSFIYEQVRIQGVTDMPPPAENPFTTFSKFLVLGTVKSIETLKKLLRKLLNKEAKSNKETNSRKSANSNSSIAGWIKAQANKVVNTVRTVKNIVTTVSKDSKAAVKNASRILVNNRDTIISAANIIVVAAWITSLLIRGPPVAASWFVSAVSFLKILTKSLSSGWSKVPNLLKKTLKKLGAVVGGMMKVRKAVNLGYKIGVGLVSAHQNLASRIADIRTLTYSAILARIAEDPEFKPSAADESKSTVAGVKTYAAIAFVAAAATASYITGRDLLKGNLPWQVDESSQEVAAVSLWENSFINRFTNQEVLQWLRSHMKSSGSTMLSSLAEKTPRLLQLARELVKRAYSSLSGMKEGFTLATALSRVGSSLVTTKARSLERKLRAPLENKVLRFTSSIVLQKAWLATSVKNRQWKQAALLVGTMFATMGSAVASEFNEFGEYGADSHGEATLIAAVFIVVFLVGGFIGLYVWANWDNSGSSRRNQLRSLQKAKPSSKSWSLPSIIGSDDKTDWEPNKNAKKLGSKNNRDGGKETLVNLMLALRRLPTVAGVVVRHYAARAYDFTQSVPTVAGVVRTAFDAIKELRASLHTSGADLIRLASQLLNSSYKTIIDVNSWTEVHAKKLLRKVFGALVGGYTKQTKASSQIGAASVQRDGGKTKIRDLAPIALYGTIVAASLAAAFVGLPLLLYVPVLIGSVPALAANVKALLAGEKTRFTFGTKIGSKFEALAINELFGKDAASKQAPMKTNRKLSLSLAVTGAVIAAVCLPAAWLVFAVPFGAIAGYYFLSILRVTENFFIGPAKRNQARSSFARDEKVRKQAQELAEDYRKRYEQASALSKAYYLLSGVWAKFSLQNPTIAGTISFLAMRVTLAVVGLQAGGLLMALPFLAPYAHLSLLSLAGLEPLANFFSYIGLPHTVDGMTRVFLVTWFLYVLQAGRIYTSVSKENHDQSKAARILTTIGLLVTAPVKFIGRLAPDTAYGKLMNGMPSFWKQFIGMWTIGAQIGVIMQLGVGIGSISQLGIAGDLVQGTIGIFEQQATSFGTQAVSQTAAAVDPDIVESKAGIAGENADLLNQPVVADIEVDGQGHVTKVLYADDSYVVYDYNTNTHADIFKYNAQDQLIARGEGDFVMVYINSSAHFNSAHKLIYDREYWATRIDWGDRVETFSYDQNVESGAFVDYYQYTKSIYDKSASGELTLIAEETYEQYSNPNQLVESKIYDSVTGNVAWTVDYADQVSLRNADIGQVPEQVRAAWQQAGIQEDTMLRPATVTDASGATWTTYSLANDPHGRQIFQDRQDYNVFSTSWNADNGEAVFSYKTTEDNQIMATLELQGYAKGQDVLAMMDRETGFIFTKTTAELIKEELGIDVDQTLAAMGVQDATQIPVVKETPFVRQTAAQGEVVYSDKQAPATMHYKMPNDPQGRDMITQYPDKTIVISSWYESRAGPAGVLPQSIAVKEDGTLGEVKTYTGEQTVNGVQCHVYSVDNGDTKTAEYRTQDNQLYRVDYDRTVLTLANMYGLTAGEERVYFDLSKPYEVALYATDEDGTVIKEWLNVAYDDAEGVEIQEVREEDRLVPGKWDVYEYKHDLYTGELISRNQVDMFKALFYQFGPLPVWAWGVVATAGLFMGISGLLKKIFLRAPSSERRCVDKADVAARQGEKTIPTLEQIEAVAYKYGFDQEQIKSAYKTLPEMFENSSRSSDDLLLDEFESFQDWLADNNLNDEWLSQQGIELRFDSDEMILSYLVFLSAGHWRSINPGWRYYLYLKTRLMQALGAKDVGFQITTLAAYWYSRLSVFYTEEKYDGLTKEYRMTYEDLEDIFNGLGNDKDFVKHLLENNNDKEILDQWEADPVAQKTYRDQFGIRGVLALGKTCWILVAGMAGSFTGLVLLVAVPSLAIVLLPVMTVVAGCLIGYALYQPGRVFKRILENNPRINKEGAAFLKKMMFRQNVSAISFWSLVLGSKFVFNYVSFSAVMVVTAAISGFALPALAIGGIIVTIWLLFAAFFVLDIFTFYYFWQWIFGMAKGYSLGLGRITDWKQLEDMAPEALESFMDTLNIPAVKREDVAASILEAIADDLLKKGLLKEEESKELAEGKFTDQPENEQASRRLIYFFNSLFMDMPAAGKWEDMPSLSVAITAAAEKVMAHLDPPNESSYEKEIDWNKKEFADLEKKQTDFLNRPQKGVGLTMLTHLIRQNKDEWLNFIAYLRGKYEDTISEEQYRAWENLSGVEPFKTNNDEIVKAVENWANLRFQADYRTVHGMINIWKAYEFLAKTVYFPDRADDMEFIKKKVAEKLQLIIAYQEFGNLGINDLRVQDLLALQEKYGCFDIVYLDAEGSVLKRKNGTYTAAGQGKINNKPMNQNNFMPWLTNDILFFLDANCDMRFEDALKLLNLLQEFRIDPLIKGINLPEYIFTDSYNWIGQAHASADRNWTTFVQRFLAMYGADGFYGHGALFCRDAVQHAGALSTDYVSEDLMMAMKIWLKAKGYRIEHREYLQAGKAREVSVAAASVPFNKFAQGSVELMLGRQFKRLMQSKDITWYQKAFLLFTLGFYVRKPLVVATMAYYVVMVMFLGISGFSAFPMLILFGFIGIICSQVISFTALGQSQLEYGILKGTWKFAKLFPKLLVIFPYYVLGYARGDKTGMSGLAQFISSAKSTEIAQFDFQKKVGDLYDSMTAMIAPVLVLAAVSCFLWQSLPIVFSLLFMWMVFSWLFTPVITAPGVLPTSTSFAEATHDRLANYKKWVSLWFDYLKNEIYGMKFFRVYDAAIAVIAVVAIAGFGFPLTFALFLLPVSSFGVMGICLALGTAYFGVKAVSTSIAPRAGQVQASGSVAGEGTHRDGGKEIVAQFIKKINAVNSWMKVQAKRMLRKLYGAVVRTLSMQKVYRVVKQIGPVVAGVTVVTLAAAAMAQHGNGLDMSILQVIPALFGLVINGKEIGDPTTRERAKGYLKSLSEAMKTRLQSREELIDLSQAKVIFTQRFDQQQVKELEIRVREVATEADEFVVLLQRDPGKQEYFVIDGHHRLLARQLCGEMGKINAYIIYSPEGKILDNSGLVKLAESYGSQQAKDVLIALRRHSPKWAANLNRLSQAGNNRDGGSYTLIKLNGKLTRKEQGLVKNFYQVDDSVANADKAFEKANSRYERFCALKRFNLLAISGQESFAAIAGSIHKILTVCVDAYPHCCYSTIGLLVDVFKGVEGITVEPRLIGLSDDNGLTTGFHFYSIIEDSNGDRWLFDPTSEQFAARDGGKVKMVSPLKSHEEIVKYAEEYYRKHGKKLLILNVDAHADLGKLKAAVNGDDSEDVQYKSWDDLSAKEQDAVSIEDVSLAVGSWASYLEAKGVAIVPHLSSRPHHNYMDRKTFLEDDGMFRGVVEAIRRHRDQVGQIWVTIDYDYFSLMDINYALYESVGQALGKTMYNLKTRQQIHNDLLKLRAFFEEQEIPIGLIVPCESREYLASATVREISPFVLKRVASTDSDYCDMVAEEIADVFDVKMISRDGGSPLKIKSLSSGWTRNWARWVKKFAKRVFGAVVRIRSTQKLIKAISADVLKLVGGELNTRLEFKEAVKTGRGLELGFTALNNAIVEGGTIVLARDRIALYDENGDFRTYAIRQKHESIRAYSDYGWDFIDRATAAADESIKKELIAQAAVSFQRAFLLRRNNRLLAERLTGMLGADEAEARLAAAMVLVDSSLVNEDTRIRCVKIIKENESLVIRYDGRLVTTDLHLHTFRSDANFSPSRVVFDAWRKGMHFIGIVDHNTTAAFREALTAAQILGIKAITGVEFDLFDNDIGLRNFHIIGYFLRNRGENIEDYTRRVDRGLAEFGISPEMEKLFERNRNKTNRYVDNFNSKYAQDGLIIEESDLTGYLNEFPNRYQVASALVDKYGLEKLAADELNQAANAYFPKGSVDVKGPDGVRAADALPYLHKAGAMVVLAHPGEKMSGKPMYAPGQVEQVLDKYEGFIDGIEAYSSKQSGKEMRKFKAVADSRNLMVTIGSDSHRESGILMGKGDVREYAIGNLLADCGEEALANARRRLAQEFDHSSSDSVRDGGVCGLPQVLKVAAKACGWTRNWARWVKKFAKRIFGAVVRIGSKQIVIKALAQIGMAAAAVTVIALAAMDPVYAAYMAGNDPVVGWVGAALVVAAGLVIASPWIKRAVEQHADKQEHYRRSQVLNPKNSRDGGSWKKEARRIILKAVFRRRALIAFPMKEADHNNAFKDEVLEKVIQDLELNGYTVEARRIGSVTELDDFIREATRDGRRKVDLVIIGGHGTKTDLLLGKGPECLLKLENVKDIKSLAKGLKADGAVALDSCSTGEAGKYGDNLSNKISDIHHKEVYAPEVVAAGVSLKFDWKGKFTGFTYDDYEEREKERERMQSMWEQLTAGPTVIRPQEVFNATILRFNFPQQERAVFAWKVQTVERRISRARTIINAVRLLIQKRVDQRRKEKAAKAGANFVRNFLWGAQKFKREAYKAEKPGKRNSRGGGKISTDFNRDGGVRGPPQMLKVAAKACGWTRNWVRWVKKFAKRVFGAVVRTYSKSTLYRIDGKMVWISANVHVNPAVASLIDMESYSAAGEAERSSGLPVGLPETHIDMIAILERQKVIFNANKMTVIQFDTVKSAGKQ